MQLINNVTCACLITSPSIVWRYIPLFNSLSGLPIQDAAFLVFWEKFIHFCLVILSRHFQNIFAHFLLLWQIYNWNSRHSLCPSYFATREKISFTQSYQILRKIRSKSIAISKEQENFGDLSNVPLLISTFFGVCVFQAIGEIYSRLLGCCTGWLFLVGPTKL